LNCMYLLSFSFTKDLSSFTSFSDNQRKPEKYKNTRKYKRLLKRVCSTNNDYTLPHTMIAQIF
jgi:hypothetical protein